MDVPHKVLPPQNRSTHAEDLNQMSFTDKEFTLLERCLQILAVIAVILTQVISFLILPPVFIYLILFTRYWWICTAYICWYVFFDSEAPEKGDRRSEFVRDWIWWVYVRNYFPAKLVKLPWGELDKNRNYLFCFFPHGLLCFGALLTLATNAVGFHQYFPNHKPHIHTISAFYQLPLVRELGLWFGGLSASKNAIKHVLGRAGGGNVSGVVVGGAAEAFHCKPGVHKLVYKKRKGFIKLALTEGAPLVPVYCFGETDTYSQVEFKEGSFLKKIQQVIKNIVGFAVIIPAGRNDVFGFLPHRSPISIVVGEPIDVQKTENPTQEQIDELHQIFEKRLIELFESQKKNYLKNYEHTHLEIT